MKKLTPFLAEIPERLREADEALNAYGRWARDRHTRRRCGSAEGHYKAPPNDDDRQPVIPGLSTPQWSVIHRALVRVPGLERVVLHVVYVPKRQPIEQQLRLLKIPHALCAQRHLAGLGMFANLWRVESIRLNVLTNDPKAFRVVAI